MCIVLDFAAKYKRRARFPGFSYGITMVLKTGIAFRRENFCALSTLKLLLWGCPRPEETQNLVVIVVVSRLEFSRVL